MSRLFLRLRGVLPCLCIVLVGVPSATADEEPFGDKPAAATAKPDTNPDHASTAKIRCALCEPTELDFHEEALSGVVAYLSDLHGIPIAFHASVEEAGAGGDIPVSAKLKNVSLQTALRLVLEPSQLTFVVRDGVLLIATPEATEHMGCLRVYDVGDLLEGGKDPDELVVLLRTMVSPHGSNLEPQLVPYDKLLVVNASLPDHDAIVEVLAMIREKLKPTGK